MDVLLALVLNLPWVGFIITRSKIMKKENEFELTSY